MLTAIAGLTIGGTAKADPAKSPIFDVPFTPEEQALYDKDAIMEMYEPTQHSGHSINRITATADKNRRHWHNVTNPEPVLALVFGMEDAEPAREEGKNMAEMHYNPQMAQQFLFAEGWDKYHDRFFTRAYVQEGMQAYEKNR